MNCACPSLAGGADAALACVDATPQAKPNGRRQPREVERCRAPDAQGEALLKSALARPSLSAPGYHRMRKRARTIAGLATADLIFAAHAAEAIG